MDIAQSIKDLVSKAAATQDPALLRGFRECFCLIDDMAEGIKDSASGADEIGKTILNQKTTQCQNKLRELVLEACTLFIEAVKQGELVRTNN